MARPKSELRFGCRAEQAEMERITMQRLDPGSSKVCWLVFHEPWSNLFIRGLNRGDMGSWLWAPDVYAYITVCLFQDQMSQGL